MLAEIEIRPKTGVKPPHVAVKRREMRASLPLLARPFRGPVAVFRDDDGRILTATAPV